MFPLSVIILTRNEEKNIAACMARLAWADEIILVDSFSADETIASAKSARPGVRIFQNAFADFGQQRNWALDQTNPKHPWILFVDADERITDECAAEIQRVVADPKGKVGFFLCYRNIFLDRWIRHCTQFPTWQLRLLKHGSVRFQKEGHGQREIANGEMGYIGAPFEHLDLSKGMSEWIAKHNEYSSQEVELLLRLQSEPLRLGDLLRDAIQRRRCLKRMAARVGGSPMLWFVYVYFLRGGFLDGGAGRIFCMLRLSQQFQVKAKLAEAKFGASAIEFHDRIADQWDGKYSHNSFCSREHALNECLNGSDLEGQQWLDAGCGSGRFSRYLAERGCKVLGVDASQQMIRIAKQDAPDISFQQIENIETMNLDPDSLDGVLCMSVLEYCANPHAALTRFSYALRPGGKIAVSVPNQRSLLRRGLRLTHYVTRRPQYLQFSRNEYRADGFTEILKSYGLSVEKQVYLGGPFPRSLQKWPAVGPLMLFVARKAG